MAKNKKKKGLSQSAQQRTEKVSICPESIRGLAEAGNTCSALKEAKAWHAEKQTQESEELLVDMYVCRINSLLSKNMAREAEELARIVESRFSKYAHRVQESGQTAAIISGHIDGLVAPLNNPDLAPEERNRIETLLKERLTDLDALANCNALSADHPLRTQARALNNAFNLVISRPVMEEDLHNLQVPRRSPLAPWRMLIFAIAAMYRHDDELCMRYMGAVEDGSVPARLKTVLLALLALPSTPRLSPKKRVLFDNITVSLAPITKTLQSTKRVTAFSLKEREDRILAYRKAFTLCKQCPPTIANEVTKRLYVECIIICLTYTDVRNYVSDYIPRANSDFWRLLARCAEYRHTPEIAVHAWYMFRAHALYEGLFKLGGPEDSVILCHMVQLRSQIDDRELLPPGCASLEQYIARIVDYSQQPTPLQTVLNAKQNTMSPSLYVNTARLFDYASQYVKDPAFYRAWLDWARQRKLTSEMEKAGHIWAEIEPTNPVPCLDLAKAARKRNALTLVRKYLQDAEKRDPLNPEVRRALIQNVVAEAIRHLKQKKPHLVAKDINTLHAIKTTQESLIGDIHVLLNLACAWVIDDQTEATTRYENLKNRFGHELGAYLAARVVAHACSLYPQERNISPQFMDTLIKADLSENALGKDIFKSLMRLNEFINVLDVDLVICPKAENLLCEWLKATKWGSRAENLPLLADFAEKWESKEFVYAISAKGLALRDVYAARYLLMRGKIVDMMIPRAVLLMAVAVMLSRHRRQMDLAAKALEALWDSADALWLPRNRVLEILDAVTPKTAQALVETELELGSQKTDNISSDHYAQHLLDAGIEKDSPLIAFLNNSLHFPGLEEPFEDDFEDDFDYDDEDEIEDDFDETVDDGGKSEEDIYRSAFEVLKKMIDSKRPMTSRKKASPKKPQDEAQRDLFDD